MNISVCVLINSCKKLFLKLKYLCEKVGFFTVCGICSSMLLTYIAISNSNSVFESVSLNEIAEDKQVRRLFLSNRLYGTVF